MFRIDCWRGGALAILMGLWLLGGSPVRAEIVTLDSDEYASLSGYVYADLDNDATCAEWERPIRGVTIRLVGVGPDDEPINMKATTDRDGCYLFDELPPGTYSILEEQPIRFVEGKPNLPGTAGGTAPDGNRFLDIELPEAFDATDYNFGEWGLRPRYVSKRTFLVIVPEPGLIVFSIAALLGLLVCLVRWRGDLPAC